MGGLLAAAALTMAATAAPASAADFNCDASALRGTVLGVGAIEPVTANRGQPACRTADGGVGVSLPATLSAHSLFARTSAQGAGRERTVGSTGGVEDLRIRSAPLAAVESFASVSIAGVGVVDLRPALRALQARTDLVSATTAVASAEGSCASGRPALSGRSQLVGLSVLGQGIAANTGDVTVSLDPSDVTDADIALLGQLPVVTPLIRAFLDGLPDIPVAQVSATIGGQTVADGKLTQQAARVRVTSAGQSVADLVLGEATVTAAGVDCAFVGLTPQQRRELQRGQDVAAEALRCTRRRLVLIDVLRRGGRVKLFGAADKRYIGERVRIVFTDTDRTVARPRVRADGTFAATAPLPPRAVRNTSRARYQAVRGGERSLRLKLTRRMVVTSLTTRNDKVTIRGRVIRPLAKPIRPITVQRRVSCRRSVAVKRFMPSRSGRFKVTVKAPKGEAAAVYRLATKVRRSTRSTRLFPTFTLPRAVSLR
jgi:hypothetical protein